MEHERWQRLEQVCQQALDRPESERAALLEAACAGDETLRREAEALLGYEKQAENYLEVPAVAGGVDAKPDEFAAAGVLEAGRVFAQRFVLVRLLGEGGMGQVWLAEQTSPVRRQVALKLIKAGMYDPSVVQRFQAERQSVAIMDHPAIAKVFEAGSTELGQPYFIMEFVPGLPITEYCDLQKLAIRQRLELLIQTCEGVQHAHRKAIIHRDLKPANILVVEVDGKPVPRIIDFGLAKATNRHVGGESLFSHPGSLVGTPAYMSPEQADPAVEDIDTRTDVYGLGAILYVLLTGLQPFDTKQPLEELLRKVREEDPPRPSARVNADGDTIAARADARRLEPRQFGALLRGDLDWITMKAMEKDRVRRYGAVSELDADIRRYLNDEPVLARPASVGYRVRKFVRRHRVAMRVVAGLALLLAGFVGVQTVELRRITRERDRANRERDRASRITDFMTGMFKVSDPSEARGNTVTAREILDKAAAEMRTGLAKDPEVQSDLLQVMARTYVNLGLYLRAHEMGRRALDARLSRLGPNDPKTLESMTVLGWIVDREGHFPEAEKLERQALAADRRILGPADPLTLETMDHLAVIVQGQGQYDQAEKLERQVIETGTRSLGAENQQILRSMNNLGVELLYQARYVEAEREYRHLLEVERRVFGPDHPETLLAMDNLATSLRGQGRLTEAEHLFRETLATEQRVLGPEHRDTSRTMQNLAAVLTDQRHWAEAEKLQRETLAIDLRTLGPQHEETLMSKLNLAGVLFEEGRFREAEELQREMLATQMRVLGPENRGTLLAQTDLARTLIRENDDAEAEKMARASFDVQLRTLGPEHPDTLDALQQLGTALAQTHRYPEAIKLFRSVIDKQTDAGSKGSGGETAWYDFACVAVAANHPDDALEYLREAIHRGFNDADGLMADDNLKNLRHNPHFRELIAALKRPPS